MITDLLSTEAVQDPYRVYADLREAGPIVWLPEHHAWFVSTYDEVHAAFRDLRLSSDRLTPLESRVDPADRSRLGPTFELLRGWMVFHDPPAHERLRAPVRRAFTPRAVAALEPQIRAVVENCLDEMDRQFRDPTSDGIVDLVRALAFPLPAIVIAELLGVPAEDRDEFKTWSTELATIVFGADARSQRATRAAAGTARFTEYFSELIGRYERFPEDNLISALIAARELADPPLGATELVGACTLLLFGGHETTTNLIGNATRTMLEHPEAMRWWRDHPEHLGPALEELHRFDGPSKVMVRIAAEDHRRAGVPIEAGQTVFLGIGSANRDPAAFADPDEVDLGRSDAHRHLGFGYGLHFCLGAPLARLEGRIALEGLIARFPDLALAVPSGQLRYGATILGRGLIELPVTQHAPLA